MSSDLRDTIFKSLEGDSFTATVFLSGEGVVCGVDSACDTLTALDCTILFARRDGDIVDPQSPVLVFSGSAKAVAIAEDTAIGCITKTTGIARASARAMDLANRHSGGRVRVVSGAIKKIPGGIKPIVRRAVHMGGCSGRIVDGPFIYLDKNYVRMFGSVSATIDGVAHMRGYTRVIQIRGQIEPLETETRAALERGVELLMVDTGHVEDLDRVSAMVREAGKRDAVTIAFSGNVTHEDIPELCSHDLDIIGMGRSIMDAPMADCSMDVTPRGAAKGAEKKPGDGMELNLLQKTELRINGITLDSANLTDIATAVAQCLSLPEDKVLVIDVRPGQLALDILVPTIRADQFFGKEKTLLALLAAMPGVSLDRDACMHSEGILGAISLDEERVPEVLARTSSMGTALSARKKGRVRIFPTGFELIERRIEDTNTPYLVKLFSQAGFMADAGDSLPDNKDALAAAIAAAAEECSLVVTTGGVGAEDKDFSVEAIESVDPLAATPYLVRFTRGEGRHVKDGIRLAVGEKDGCIMVALPGPHDEVRLLAPILLRGIKERQDIHVLAETLASRLRGKLRGMHAAHKHHPQHARGGHGY
ncbi:putative nicotinate-nucleotide pyrophosphorylase [carboxylating] [Pseudodesulfovibrio hydrargyri]|uniref:Putative nicotinate-nucleotide pyrophosphorylase [carboxylating] n=1 Tax=Pseudodesulfovibrio hydrargyri TaxID=2125990 RepID=A0A1J5MXI3_9BACT|nr:molybdopterin-binding protein [Pseudodesulfovibrio hydrargyri]OIQ50532.1 putative nicotinate-nucleotide pyrophosphorylase [carboxylating] [Pseudodesulfovibrio hydrargyri]